MRAGLKAAVGLALAAGFVSTAGGGSARAAEPAEAWEPAKTWVFMVGLLEWQDPKYGSFAKEARRDELLLETLKARGVPPGQVTYLQDEEATTERVGREFLAFLEKPRHGDWAFVYYCGHGYNGPEHKESFFVTYDANDEVAGWPVSGIPAAINARCKASYAILAADNCNSGSLATAVRRLKNPKLGYAAFASAHWNSGSTGNWTFTEDLVYAFRGDAIMDDDANGRVTFAELRDNVVEDMTFAESQMPQSAIVGDLRPEFAIGPTAGRPDRGLGERGEYLVDGDWWPGYTIGRDGDKRKVRFYGYTQWEERWVSPAEMRPPTKKPEHPAGTRCKVLSQGEWYDAQIVGVRNGLHHVKFDGWAAEWNEWVTADKIRLPERRGPARRGRG